MPINPFSPQNQPEENIKRNDFDLSNSSVFTTDFFKLYPAFCKEVLPGDTFEIDFQLGVRGMPTVFPVQTKMRMSMEFYYVRNRTLHDKFEDMIFKTKDVEHPWIRLTRERAKQMVSTGSLGDALGIPTTVGGNFPISSAILNVNPMIYKLKGSDQQYNTSDSDFIDYLLNSSFDSLTRLRVTTSSEVAAFGYHVDLSDVPFVDFPDTFYTVSISSGSSPSFASQHRFVALVVDDKIVSVESASNVVGSLDNNFSSSIPQPIIDKFESLRSGGYRTIGLSFILLPFGSSTDISDSSFTQSVIIPFYGDPRLFANNSFPSKQYPLNALNQIKNFNVSRVIDSTSDLFIDSNPFVGVNPDIRLNALPFRAYEQICNYYYRNDKNNPYYLDGEPQYNEFIPTHASGPDDNVYNFHYRNWELDCFTSAQQSPQFGDAPLVGLTWQGSNDVELEFQATNTQTSVTKGYKVRVGLDDDDNVDSILDFSPDVPSADLQRLQRRIQAGLSINDLRVTNSFQRFLENTMRRGLRYRNQLKSHFGVSVDYPDIDVPQYIGGFSSELDTGQVTNMADSPNAGLGDYIGTLQGSMSSQNTIRQYCPEHGFIIGVFSMSPVPSYPQSINSYLLHDGPMTYYQTEFRHIGFVPIRHKFLDPLQTPLNGSVNDVFGYQMANYEYKRSLDEVHGDFRTTLRDWVLTRTFKERPTLTESFTVGKPEQLNDVFVTQNIADAYGSNAKFLCSARFHCVALRQIPIVGTPALE